MNNTVPPGYKQTEVGVIPEEWEVKPLRGLVDILHGFGFQSQYFCEMGSYRLTTPGHFYESGGFRDVGEKQKYYDGPLPDSFLLNKGDLIVAMTEQADGLLGSAAFIPASGTYLHNQRLGKIKILDSGVCLDYLFLVFNSSLYRAKVRETAAGTKVRHTSPAKLLEIPVCLPPTENEQRAIATTLSDVDALIASLDKLIAKKRDMKQAAMQELLTGKRRLPGFSGEWEEKPLGNYVEISSGESPSRFNLKDDGIPFFKVEQLNNNDKYLADTPYYFQAGKTIPRGSIIFPKRGASIMLNKVRILVADSFMDTNLMTLTPAESLNSEYLYYALTHIELWRIADTTSIPQINNKHILPLMFLLPPLPEQTAIAAILSDMDTEIAALEQKRDKTRLLKQGMMQELLTGRIRLV